MVLGVNVRVDDLYLIFLTLYLMGRCIASDVFRVPVPSPVDFDYTLWYRLEAVKALRQDLTANRDRQRRFLQEARSAAALSHPSIAQIYDVDEADGVTFIAMEFVEGKTVSQLIRNHELDLVGAVGGVCFFASVTILGLDLDGVLQCRSLFLCIPLPDFTSGTHFCDELNKRKKEKNA